MNHQRYPVSNSQLHQVDNQQTTHDLASAQFQYQMQQGPPMPFDPHMMGPPPNSRAGNMPNPPFPIGLSQLTEQSLSASALERLQLPKDMITETGIIPSNPYYKLPAGLMVPLIPASRTDYQPIEPRDLRLPFPKFPDENFLRMIDSYYANDGDKRDNDGWERKFIDTYLKQKEALSRMQSESNQ